MSGRGLHRRPPHGGWGPGGGWGPSSGWSEDQRDKFRWFRRLMLAVLALTLLVPTLLAAALTAAFTGWTGAAAAAMLSLTVVVVAVLLGRFVFRGFRSVNDMMGVTGRLADGDYSARIGSEVPPALGPVVESFNRMAERLERSDELRRRLLADVGHELRTPLTVIRGELEAMADGVHEMSETELRRLLVDVAGMERLLDDLKTLSTTEAGVLDLEPEPIDLTRLVADTVARFRSEAVARGIALTVRPAGDDSRSPTIVAVDSMRIGEVITNLVTNAMRAVDEGGRIEVTVDRGVDEGAMIVVADDGAGIPPDQVELIFDRFAKGRESTGSGLGLTISRSLVEAHGGSIAASSVEGEGTTMTVYLPDSQPRNPVNR